MIWLLAELWRGERRVQFPLLMECKGAVCIANANTKLCIFKAFSQAPLFLLDGPGCKYE